MLLLRVEKKRSKHYLRGLLLGSKETKIYSQVTRLTRSLLLLCSVFLVSVQFTSFWCHTATSWSFCSNLLCWSPLNLLQESLEKIFFLIISFLHIPECLVYVQFLPNLSILTVDQQHCCVYDRKPRVSLFKLIYTWTDRRLSLHSRQLASCSVSVGFVCTHTYQPV